MKMRPLHALGIVLLCRPHALLADTVILSNGERIQGTVVSESATEVRLRRTFGTGNIKYVDPIKRSAIARIEKGVDEATSEPTLAAPASRPAESGPKPIADKPAFLKLAIAKYQDGQFAAAGVDLSRLINASTPAELQQFSKEVEKTIQMSLADLAADAHLTAGTDKRHSQPIRLSNITSYETPSLVAFLIQDYDAALKEEVTVKPVVRAAAKEKEKEKVPHVRRRSAESRPAGAAAPRPAPVNLAGPAVAEPDATPADPAAAPGNGLAIATWIDRPNDFDADKPEASALLSHLHYTNSLLTERMRIDPTVRRDRTLKTALTGEQRRLAALTKAVASRAGGALTAAERNAKGEEEEERDELRRQQQERQRLTDQNELSKLLRLAEQQANQPKQPQPLPKPEQPPPEK